MRRAVFRPKEGKKVIFRQVKTAGGIIHHGVEVTRVVEDRRVEQGHTVHIITEAKKNRQNQVNSRSLPEVPADSRHVIAACQECVPGMAQSGEQKTGLL